MPDPRRREERKRADIPGAAEYAGVGIQFAATLLLFLFAGRWLDRKLGTDPWLLMLGVLLGFGLSLYSIYTRLNSPASRKGGPDERKKD